MQVDGGAVALALPKEKTELSFAGMEDDAEDESGDAGLDGDDARVRQGLGHADSRMHDQQGDRIRVDCWGSLMLKGTLHIAYLNLSGLPFHMDGMSCE